MKTILLQLRFFTRIPFPGSTAFDERTFGRGIWLAPLVGLLIGSIEAGAFLLLNIMGLRVPALLAAVIAGIVVTGGLHLDGLADTCDGFFSNRPREEILRIMRDSRIGTNGTLALVLVILTKLGLLFSLPANAVIPALVVMPVLSRMTVSWAAALAPYAREGAGLASPVVAQAGAISIAAATALGTGIAASLYGLRALPLAGAVIACALLCVWHSRRRIGGITGDVIGAVIELSEAAFLAAALAVGHL